jgi:hypothetical protein
MFDVLTLEAVRLLHAFVSTKFAELLAAVNARASEVTWYVNNTSGVKSIQRGVISMNGTTAAVTITPVDMSKAELRVTGFRQQSLDCMPTVVLTASNTITATRILATATTYSYVAWELTEWK